MSTTKETAPLSEELLDQPQDAEPDLGMYEAEDWGEVDESGGGSLPWKKIVVWALVLVFGGSVLLTLGVQLSSGGSGESGSGAAVVDPVTDMQSRAWQGASFPISAEHGPDVFDDTRAMGFAQTAKGAALAALHIASRISPYNGPAVFTPTITEQVTGDTSALLTLMEGEYSKVAKENGLKNGEPLIRPTGEMLAWRIEGGFTPERNNVQLYVKTPRSTEVIYSVPVVWVDGDWKIERQTDDAGLTFGVDPYEGNVDFEAFIPSTN